MHSLWITCAALFLFELTAPLAFVLVWFYNGQRGACSPLQKKAFYWFYPVHLTCWPASPTCCCDPEGTPDFQKPVPLLFCVQKWKKPGDLNGSSSFFLGGVGGI